MMGIATSLPLEANWTDDSRATTNLTAAFLHGLLGGARLAGHELTIGSTEGAASLAWGLGGSHIFLKTHELLLSIKNCRAKLLPDLAIEGLLALFIPVGIGSFSVARLRPGVVLVLTLVHAPCSLVDILLAGENLPEVVDRELVLGALGSLWATCGSHHDLTQSYMLLLGRARFLTV